ncbi:MAG: branched-chain amino acid ABC transporter permease [Acidimicrobiales bacterium]
MTAQQSEPTSYQYENYYTGLPFLKTIIALILLAAPFVTSDLQLRRFSQVLVLVLAVLGVNFCTGYAGLVSLGHGVFVGIGAFAMANYLDELSLGFLPALLLATITTGLFGIVLGLPALRIKGIYLALLTFGFALVFGPVARRLGPITGGVNGRSVEFDGDPPAWTGLAVERTQLYRYILCVLVVLVWFVLSHGLINSRIGRAIRAVRDDETAAASFGIDLTVVKMGAFGISAAMAGSAGALQTFLFPFVSHSKFEVFLSLRLYAAAVIGGLGTLVGAVYGVASLLLVPVVGRILGAFGSETIVFGLALILLTYLAPTGIAGIADRLGAWIRSLRKR